MGGVYCYVIASASADSVDNPSPRNIEDLGLIQGTNRCRLNINGHPWVSFTPGKVTIAWTVFAQSK